MSGPNEIHDRSLALFLASIIDEGPELFQRLTAADHKDDAAKAVGERVVYLAVSAIALAARTIDQEREEKREADAWVIKEH